MAVQNAIGKGNFKIVVSKSCKKSALYISERNFFWIPVSKSHKKSALYKSEGEIFWKLFVKMPVFFRIVRRFFKNDW